MLVYTIISRDDEVIQMETLKLFAHGQSQAVRLPKTFRFSGDEIYTRKIGQTAMLFPKDSAWSTFTDGLNGFTTDFMSSGRELTSEQEKEI